ncbi:HHL065Wp [Eremothecium sinecaudum]|uniref:HHL065Wp n=1 Tax=Eremothecium sinecaudum TaxID=45286 RepID=A0A0X8HWE2_9SACH|nr:HHL065Wp [Eremothecium sinecaudum]AMD22705.1 HHL065Wp [Eremothecium sinecaudum]
MIVIKRSYKVCIAVLLLLRFLFSTALTDSKLHKAFLSSFRRAPFLPTTSHVKGLNLKSLEPSEFSEDNLRWQLAKYFPYNPDSKIPKRVWQTWRNPLGSRRFPANFKDYSEHWQSITSKSNGGYSYNFISDNDMLPVLESLYGEMPLIIKAFNAIPKRIMKADFFRYLIIYARGGIYSDIDTVPIQTLDQWPSANRNSLEKYLQNRIKYGPNSDQESNSNVREPGLVIGIEADPDRPDWSEYYARRIQFCQWTIQSKPGHPVLRELILNITTTTLFSTQAITVTSKQTKMFEEEHLDDYNVNFRHNRLHDKNYKHQEKKTDKNSDGTDIMNWTGPGIFSDIVFDYFNNLISSEKDIPIFNNNLLENDVITGERRSYLTSTLKFYDEIQKSLITPLPKIGWEFFSLMQDPVVIDDVVVLPITSFSPGVNQMGAEDIDHPLALVQHLFEGTWKE